MADFFIQKLKELGGEVVGDLSYQSQDVDFKAQLTQIKSKNPDIQIVGADPYGSILSIPGELNIEAPPNKV